jgi:hypothetical protein
MLSQHAAFSLPCEHDNSNCFRKSFGRLVLYCCSSDLCFVSVFPSCIPMFARVRGQLDESNDQHKQSSTATVDIRSGHCLAIGWLERVIETNYVARG